MKSNTGEDLKIGDKVVYVTTSYHWPSMRFGVITDIINGTMEERIYRNRISYYRIPGKIKVLDVDGKKRFTRGNLVYKLDEVNKMFDEVK